MITVQFSCCFCHAGCNSFFQGWFPAQNLQFFRFWCLWCFALRSYFCFQGGFVGCTFSWCTSSVLLDAPEIFLIWEEAASLLLLKSMHFLRSKFLSCSKHFGRVWLFIPRTMWYLYRLSVRLSQNPHVLTRDCSAVMYALIDSSWPWFRRVKDVAFVGLVDFSDSKLVKFLNNFG